MASFSGKRVILIRNNLEIIGKSKYKNHIPIIIISVEVSPGQLAMLQFFLWVLLPEQSLPPPEGEGLSQDRCLFL